jgi:hypothetical protein
MSQEKLFTVSGVTVDGRVWFGAMGWTGNRRLAYVMRESDAKAIAETEAREEEARTGRNPDNGIYGIAAIQWIAPSLYSFAEYQADCEESARFDALYGESL